MMRHTCLGAARVCAPGERQMILGVVFYQLIEIERPVATDE